MITEKLELASISSQIECEEEAFWPFFRKRYGGFFSHHDPSFFVTVLIDPCSEEAASLVVENQLVDMTLTYPLLQVQGRSFAASFNFDEGRGEIHQPLTFSSLDLLLKVIYSFYLMREGGFFLHASAVVRKEKGYAFFGPSGSGKSTVAGLSTEGVLSDELVIVRGRSEGYRVYGTPFWRGVNRSAPLRGLFHLYPDRKTSVQPLSPGEGLRAIASSLGFFLPEGTQQQRLLTLAGRLVETIPCFTLHFVPDQSLWRVVDAVPIPGGV